MAATVVLFMSGETGGCLAAKYYKTLAKSKQAVEDTWKIDSFLSPMLLFAEIARATVRTGESRGENLRIYLKIPP